MRRCEGLRAHTHSSKQWRRCAKISGATLAQGAAPGIGVARMTEYVPTSHQLMIALVILSNQPEGSTQQSVATSEGVALD